MLGFSPYNSESEYFLSTPTLGAFSICKKFPKISVGNFRSGRARSIWCPLEGIDEEALRPSVTFRDLLYKVTMIETTIYGEPVCLRLVPLMFACG